MWGDCPWQSSLLGPIQERSWCWFLLHNVDAQGGSDLAVNDYLNAIWPSIYVGDLRRLINYVVERLYLQICLPDESCRIDKSRDVIMSKGSSHRLWNLSFAHYLRSWAFALWYRSTVTALVYCAQVGAVVFCAGATPRRICLHEILHSWISRMRKVTQYATYHQTQEKESTTSSLGSKVIGSNRCIYTHLHTYHLTGMTSKECTVQHTNVQRGYRENESYSRQWLGCIASR